MEAKADKIVAFLFGYATAVNGIVIGGWLLDGWRLFS